MAATGWRFEAEFGRGRIEPLKLVLVVAMSDPKAQYIATAKLVGATSVRSSELSIQELLNLGIGRGEAWLLDPRGNIRVAVNETSGSHSPKLRRKRQRKKSESAQWRQNLRRRSGRVLHEKTPTAAPPLKITPHPHRST